MERYTWWVYTEAFKFNVAWNSNKLLETMELS
jgi:hypothetical protein